MLHYIPPNTNAFYPLTPSYCALTRLNVFPSSSVFSVPSVVTPLPHLSHDQALSLTRVQRMLLVPAGDDVAEQVEDLILGQRIEQALWHD